MPLNLPTHNSKSGNKNGCLYVVGTPIGNKDDITLRALNILGEVDIVAAEDTRHTGRLLSQHKIKRRLVSYHEHNENARTTLLINKLKQGLSVALVADAGTPSVSDPGYRLIKEAVASGIRVIPVPGVSAAITALSASGLPTDSFVFVGFVSKKKSKRIKQLAELAGETRTLIFYESPKRIVNLLDEIIAAMGDRYSVLSREMTKLHEEFIRGPLSEIISVIKKRSSIKGECTLLVMGCEINEAISIKALKNIIEKRLKVTGGGASEISKEIARQTGLPKSKVYDELLKIKGEKVEALEE